MADPVADQPEGAAGAAPARPDGTDGGQLNGATAETRAEQRRHWRQWRQWASWDRSARRSGVGGAPGGEGAAAGPDVEEDPDTYRGRMWTAAAARGIPLPTILTTVLVTFLVLDVNALVIILLWSLRRIILFVVMAGFIALLLSPAVRFFERRGLSRGLAVSVVFLAALIGGVALVIAFTAPLVNAVTRFAHDLPNLVHQAEHGRGRLGSLLKRLHLQQWVEKNAPKLGSDITKSLKPAQAFSVGAAAFSTVVALGTVAVLSLFLLLQAPMLRRSILGAMSPARATRVSRVYAEVARSVTGYMFGNVLTSVIAGVVVFVTLLIVGVPFAPLLGLWVALVDLLPLVGGLLAGVPVAIVALFHSLPAFIVVVIVFLVYQQVENHILNPVIMSKTVRLNPLWVLFAVLIGAELGGRVGSGLGAFVGALIGIPVGAAIQVTIREIRRGPGARRNPVPVGGDVREPAPPGPDEEGTAPGSAVTVP